MMQTATGYSSLLIQHLVSTTCLLFRPMLNFCAMEVSGEVDLISILSSMVKEWAVPCKFRDIQVVQQKHFSVLHLRLKQKLVPAAVGRPLQCVLFLEPQLFYIFSGNKYYSIFFVFISFKIMASLCGAMFGLSKS